MHGSVVYIVRTNKQQPIQRNALIINMPWIRWHAWNSINTGCALAVDRLIRILRGLDVVLGTHRMPRGVSDNQRRRCPLLWSAPPGPASPSSRVA